MDMKMLKTKVNYQYMINCEFCGSEIKDYLNTDNSVTIGGLYFHKECAKDYIRNSINMLKESWEQQLPLQNTDSMPFTSVDEIEDTTDENGQSIWTSDDQRDYELDKQRIDTETLG